MIETLIYLFVIGYSTYAIIRMEIKYYISKKSRKRHLFLIKTDPQYRLRNNITLNISKSILESFSTNRTIKKEDK